MIEIVKEGYF